MSDYSIIINAVLNTANLQQQLNNLNQKGAGKGISVPIGVDVANAERDIARAMAKIKATVGSGVVIDKSITTSMASGVEKITAATLTYKDLQGKVVQQTLQWGQNQAGVAGLVNTTNKYMESGTQILAKQTAMAQSNLKATEQMQTWQTKLAGMQVGKGAEFGTTQVQTAVGDLNKLLSSFGTQGGASVAQVNNAFKVLEQTVKQTGLTQKQNIEIAKAQVSANQQVAAQQVVIAKAQVAANQEVAKQQSVIAKAQIAAKQDESKRVNDIAKAQVAAQQEDTRRSQTAMNRIQTEANAENKIFDNRLRMTAQYTSALQTIAKENQNAFKAPAVQQAATNLQNLINTQDGSRKSTLALRDSYKELQNQVYQTNATATTGLRGWIGEMGIALSRTVTWGLSMGAIYGTMRKFNEATQYIKDLNKELTNIQLVTGASNAEIATLSQSYNKLATDLGATTLEVARGSLSWARQGKTAEETAILLRNSMMMSKLAAIDSAEATEYMTSILNGFQLEAKDMAGVLDSLVKQCARTYGNIWELLF